MAGAIDGRPSRMAENAACAKTPAERIAQRYLRACAVVELTQLPDLLGIRPGPVLAWHFEHHRKLLKLRVREKSPESLAHQTLEDVVVPVAVGAERHLRVVRMEDAQPLESDPARQVVEQPVEGRPVGDVDTGGVQMTRVQTDAQAFVPVEGIEDRRELLERTADRPSRARGVLEQQPGALVAALEQLLQSRHHPAQARFEARSKVRADVDDDGIRLDRTRGVHRGAHGVDALRVDGLVGSREVDEVERVHDRRHAGLLAPLAEALEVLRLVVRKPPGARTLDEQLHRLGAHGDRVVESLLDPAGAVGAEEHASNLTACPFVSAWRRARPASCTSGTSARRSSTGCSRATTAASSACESRTPTRAGRSRRRRSRSRSRCAGSGSTGTGPSPSSSTACTTARTSLGGSWRRARPTRTRGRSASACPTRASPRGRTLSAGTSSSRTRSSRTSSSSARTGARRTTSPRRWRTSGTGSPTSSAAKTTSRTRPSRSTSSVPSGRICPCTRTSHTCSAPTASRCRSATVR